MAEALLRHQGGELFDVYSAGSKPEHIDPRAISSIERFGLSTHGLRSKSIDEFANQHFDYIITLCNKAANECQLPKGASEYMAWDFEDPKTRPGFHPFDTTLKELSERIKMFILIQSKESKSGQ